MKNEEKDEDRGKEKSKLIEEPEKAVEQTEVPVEILTDKSTEPLVAQPTITEVELKEPKPEPPTEIQKIGNKTIERKGDKVTITEVMGTAQSESGTAQIPVFEPFKQKTSGKNFCKKSASPKSEKLPRF